MVVVDRLSASEYVRLTSPRGSVTTAAFPASPPIETVPTATEGDVPPVSPAPLPVIRDWYLPASVPEKRTSQPPPACAVTTTFPVPIEERASRAESTVAALAL